MVQQNGWYNETESSRNRAIHKKLQEAHCAIFALAMRTQLAPMNGAAIKDRALEWCAGLKKLDAAKIRVVCGDGQAFIAQGIELDVRVK